MIPSQENERIVLQPDLFSNPVVVLFRLKEFDAKEHVPSNKECIPKYKKQSDNLRVQRFCKVSYKQQNSSDDTDQRSHSTETWTPQGDKREDKHCCHKGASTGQSSRD